MPSIKTDYTKDEQRKLLTIAAQSIKFGLSSGHAIPVDLSLLPASLSEVRATFVTLEIQDQLRGCIGKLNASFPLAKDVAENAFSAAFKDPRFPPLSKHEFERLQIHISILSKSEPIDFKSEEDLLKKIRPEIDGLILSEGHQRGTFLPSVWESLPDKASFLQQLKQKTGLPFDYWSNTLQVERYTTFSFGSPIADIHH